MMPIRAGRERQAWLLAAVLAGGAALGPYVAVGPDDFEEYFTGVVSTQLAWRALLDGALPLWNVNLGLGVPQPLRFHFITHPLAPLCTVADCQLVLRIVAALHVLAGCVAMGLLALRFVPSRGLALLAGLTYLMSSSVIQPLLTDDWPLTAINESALPVLAYTVAVLGERRGAQALLWALALGWMAGVLLSMSFPVVTLVFVALVAAAAPGFVRQWPWFALAAAITVLIGGAQLHHFYDELSLTPAGVVRRSHGAVDPWHLLWTLFMRPIDVQGMEASWRTAYFGAPFALLAAWALVRLRSRTVLVLQAGFVVALVAMFVPPRWLFELNTAQWLYRTELNVFGTLLAICVLGRWNGSSNGHVWVRSAVALQLCALGIAFAPSWLSIARVAIGVDPPGRHRLQSPGIAEEIAAVVELRPGRVILAPAASEATRRPRLNSAGLAANQLATLGVPIVSAVAFGLTTGALYPQNALLEGEILAVAETVGSERLLDVLGIRYVVALGDEPVAPTLRPLRHLAGNLTLYENSDAWPEAFFVDAVPRASIPRLPGCAHQGFLCADFSAYALDRRSESVRVSRLHDGVQLSFAPADRERDLILTQWFRSGWTVTRGRASIHRALEQLIAVHVEPGEEAVRVRFRPAARLAWWGVSIGTQVIVAGIILALVLRRVRAGAGRPRPLPRRAADI